MPRLRSRKGRHYRDGVPVVPNHQYDQFMRYSCSSAPHRDDSIHEKISSRLTLNDGGRAVGDFSTAPGSKVVR